MNTFHQWLKQSKKNGITAIALLLVVLGIVGIVSEAFAITTRSVRVVEDGGGGGGDYTIPRARIPEITPPVPGGTELVISDTFTGSVDADDDYNVQIPHTYWYAWNRFMTPSNGDSAIQGYVTALSQPNITIGYDFGVFDAASGDLIERGETVNVGQELKFTFGPYVPDNIFWFGTGYSMDSPYGEWRTDAAAPARSGGKVTCETKDFTAKYFLPGYNMTFDVYIPFVVHPPARSLVSIPSNLECGSPVASGGVLGTVTTTCKVVAEGPIAPKFRYEATYGKFYYRYYDYRNMGGSWGGPGCYGNNIPMTTKFGQRTGPAYNNNTTIEPASTVSIPVKEIPYPLTAGTGSLPPGAPTMVCPSSSVDIGEDVVVTVSAVDPEGGQVRYGVDWIDDGTNEVNSGWSALGASGSPASFTKSGGFSTSGTKTVYGVAEDATNARSVWGSCTVQVSSAPECSDSSDNDGDGMNNYPADPGCSSDNDNSESPNPGPAPTARLDAAPETVVVNTAAMLTWDSTNATTCTGEGFSTGGATSGTVSTGPLLANRNYQVTCRGSGGQISDTATVSVTNPIVTISAEPDRVVSGDEALISWTTSECANVSVTGTNGFTSSGITGTNVPSGPITGQTTFTVSCEGGSASDTVIVNIIPQYQEF